MALVRVGSEAEASNARDYLKSPATPAPAAGSRAAHLSDAPQRRPIDHGGKDTRLAFGGGGMVQSIIDTAQAAQEAA